ncbi:MAG: SRPBCC family protein [Acidiferrobacterales bacterium]|nr:SRPBCC family protein [Acidiferrobacterales bacterium]
MLALLALLAASQPLSAADVRSVHVMREDGGYALSFELYLALDPERVHALLTDYAGLPSMIDPLKRSKVLAHYTDGRMRVRLDFEGCVVMFCKTVRQTKDIERAVDLDITTVIVPEAGDLQWGWERWQIRGREGRTQLQYYAQFVPDFFVPPLLTSWLLKSELKDVLRVTGMKMEVLGGK